MAVSPSLVLREAMAELQVLVARVESTRVSPTRSPGVPPPLSLRAPESGSDQASARGGVLGGETYNPENDRHLVDGWARGDEHTPALSSPPAHRHLEDEDDADFVPLATPPPGVVPGFAAGGGWGPRVDTEGVGPMPMPMPAGAPSPSPPRAHDAAGPLSPSAATMGLVLEDRVGSLTRRLAEAEAKVGRMWRIFERELDTRDAELAQVVEDLHLLTQAHEAVLRRTALPPAAALAGGHEGRVAELELSSLRAQLAERDFQNASLRAELLRATGGVLSERAAPAVPRLHLPSP